MSALDDLIKKWEKTGLLGELKGSARVNMAILLESEANQLYGKKPKEENE